LNGIGKWDVYKVKISIAMGLIGFLINLIPMDVTINAIKFSILPGIFTALFIAQIWGLRYGLLTALFGSTQTMWLLWTTDGYGIFYSVPVYTIWIIWHGYMSDKRKADTKPVLCHNKYLQEGFIRLIIELGFWSVFPLLLSLNPPPWVDAPDSVSRDFLVYITIKHTAVAFVMLLLTDLLTGFSFIRKIFKLRKMNETRFFIIHLVILWSVFFWILDASILKLNFLELKTFFSSNLPLSTVELMFINYPVTNFIIRIVFALFMIAGALIIFDFYRRERHIDITFKKIFENSKDIIFLLSSDGKIHKINKAGRSLSSGEKEAEMIDEVLIPDSTMKISQLIITHDGEARFLAKFVNSNEKTIDCVTSCIDKEKNEYLLMGRDITESLKMNEKLKSLNENLISSYEELEASYEEIEQNNNILEEKNKVIEQNRQELEKAFKDMKESEERYENLYKSNEYIMQSIPEMIVRFNKKGEVLWMNKAFRQRFELTEQQCNIGDVFVNGVPLINESTFQQVWSNKINNSFSLAVLEDFILNILAVPAPEKNEIILIMFDITKMRMREEYFKNAKKASDEAAAMKDEFIAKISHELRTPMNGIITASTLINDLNQSLDTDMQEYLSIIQISSKRLMTTINELLDISKLEKGQEDIKMEQVDLYQVFEGIKSEFTVFAKQKHLNFSTAIEDDVPRYCYLDREKILHILSNLIFNAIKFTKEGFVKVVIKGKRVSSESFELTFFVMDSGIGIPEEKQEKVFEKFSQVDNSYTREFEGTGLGLAISQGIAKVLNSKIKLQSAPGKGTTFYFSLIAKEAQPQKIEFINHSLDDDLERIKNKHPLIFVAEDDPVNAKLLAKVLNRFGCKVKTHDNAIDLLESLKKEIPDLIFMDIQMPGMNGMEATKIIKSNPDTKAIPVIALSAHVFQREKEKSFKSGINDYLTKPINQKLLLESLLKNLE